MRFLIFSIFICALSSCDSQRAFEKNYEFKERVWKVSEPVEFDFQIGDSTKKYNVFVNVRNSLDYPYVRLFFNYELISSDKKSVSKNLITEYLFDQKTGIPFGESGLGDVYDHQFLLLKNFSFKKIGSYHLKVEQFMRTDNLPGIMAVGLRVETAKPKN